ncbi:MAG: hypothetical protein MRJ92_02190 [Nitrospira sp.]|nr:hypothetical protein [Nitrospira sp.]
MNPRLARANGLRCGTDETARWEQERLDIRARIEKVLGEIDLLECLDEPKEVAFD